MRWHSDDDRTSAHRPRAKKRQSGSDAPRTRTRQVPSPPHSVESPSPPTQTTSSAPANTSSTTSDSNANSTTATTTNSNQVSSLKVKKLSALPTGNLVISERLNGNDWTVTINSNHPLYDEFVSKIRDL